MALAAVGSTAADFALPDQAGTIVRLSELCAAGPAVLFFYPKDDTTICTKEACGFRDAHARFTQLGASVVGLSRDDGESHAAFARAHALPYSLLVDDQSRVAESFGVKKTLALLPGRATFVVDTGRVIRLAFSAAFKAQSHVDEALRVVEKLSPR